MDRIYTKKLTEGDIFKNADESDLQENDSDTPITLKDVLNSFKRAVFYKLKWSLYEIDNTDFFNLLSFFNGIISEGDNGAKTKIINGEKYTLSESGPAWL